MLDVSTDCTYQTEYLLGRDSVSLIGCGYSEQHT